MSSFRPSERDFRCRYWGLVGKGLVGVGGIQKEKLSRRQ